MIITVQVIQDVETNRFTNQNISFIRKVYYDSTRSRIELTNIRKLEYIEKITDLLLERFSISKG